MCVDYTNTQHTTPTCPRSVAKVALGGGEHPTNHVGPREPSCTRAHLTHTCNRTRTHICTQKNRCLPNKGKIKNWSERTSVAVNWKCARRRKREAEKGWAGADAGAPHPTIPAGVGSLWHHWQTWTPTTVTTPPRALRQRALCNQRVWAQIYRAQGVLAVYGEWCAVWRWICWVPVPNRGQGTYPEPDPRPSLSHPRELPQRVGLGIGLEEHKCAMRECVLHAVGKTTIL